MILDCSNYYSSDADREFFSASQFKDFLKCPAMAMAKLRGDYTPEYGRALLLGSYVDELLTGTPESINSFIEENRSELFQKNGKYYADVAQANDAIARIAKQPKLLYYLGGEHQVIMTGAIEGVPFKIKMDSFQPGEYITDLKYMASLRSPNLFKPMVEYWGYDIQAAIYQEIVRQNTGERLPFFFVVATKEKPTHLALGKISDWNAEKALNVVKQNIEGFQRIKRGELPAERCEDYGCDFCTETKIITEPIDTDLFGMSAAQIKSMSGEI